MNLKAITKLMVLFSACFMSVLLVAVYANVNGSLSPRGLGILLALVCVAGFFGFWAALTKIGRKTGSTQILNDKRLDEAAIRKKLVRDIRFCRFGIAFLVLCLVIALAEAKDGPILPLSIGIVMNLLFTTSLVSRLRQLKKALAERPSPEIAEASGYQR
jgi:hypothetical protein